MKSLITLGLILVSLFSLTLLRTQERKLGYEVFELRKEQRELTEERRRKSIQIAKLSRPQHIEAAVSGRTHLRKVQQTQVIHLSGSTNLDSVSASAASPWKGKLN